MICIKYRNGLKLEINRLSLFSFSISLNMAFLWDVGRPFKHFHSLKEFMKIFLISFQKVQQNFLVRPSLTGHFLFSITIKDSYISFSTNSPSQIFFCSTVNDGIGVSFKNYKSFLLSFCSFSPKFLIEKKYIRLELRKINIASWKN